MDIALFVKNDRFPPRIHAYEGEIERLLSQKLSLPLPIEVRVSNGAPIPFTFSVIRGRLLVDRHPESRIEFVTKIIARYLDLEPVLRHHAKEAFSDETQP